MSALVSSAGADARDVPPRLRLVAFFSNVNNTSSPIGSALNTRHCPVRLPPQIRGKHASGSISAPVRRHLAEENTRLRSTHDVPARSPPVRSDGGRTVAAVVAPPWHGG